jgi:hypothetical protein
MAFECPFCRRSVDPRAEICPHCISDISYQRPHSPLERMHGVQGTVKCLGWELFFRLILLVPFALLMGIPFLPVIFIVGGLYLFYKLALAAISADIDSVESKSEAEQKTDSGSPGSSHE